MKKGFASLGKVIAKQCQNAGSKVASTVSEWDKSFDNHFNKLESKVCAEEIEDRKELDNLVADITKSATKSDIKDLLTALQPK